MNTSRYVSYSLCFCLGALLCWFAMWGAPGAADHGAAGQTVVAGWAGLVPPAQRAEVPSDPVVVVHRVPQNLPIPAELSFCGEAVPLHDPDVLERFEKELYILANLNYQVVFHLKRIPRTFPYIEQKLRSAGMPEDLKYLALIESDLIPTLISSAGARGLWQFMAGTARDYAMKVDDQVDERLHLDKSTDAAFRYLKNAREKTGSWAMAAAAYNMGLARAQSTMKEQYVSDYYRLHMNQETSRYVFKILAAKTILENPEAYGYDLASVRSYESPRVKEVRIAGAVADLPKWAVDQGTTYYDLRRLNPWLVGKSLPAGNYTVHVPIE